MKILFIASSMEKPNPSWHLMKALMEDVLEQGIKIHAIQRHHESATMPPFPQTIQNHANFSYSEVLGKAVDKKAFVKRYLDGICFAWKLRRHLREHNDYDAIFIQSSPTSFYTLLCARHYAKKRPVIFNSQDMFPGSAIATGVVHQKWMQKVFYWMQKIAYRKATVITAISDDMKQKLIEQGVPAEKIQVIVNWYDDTTVEEIPWEENRFVKQENMSPEKFYVQYAGTMGNVFNYRIILDVAEKLKAYPDICFQMIGNGVKHAPFEKEAQERGLDNITFLPLQSQDMVPHVYSACSVCLIPLKRGVIGNSVPSKAGLLMACGRVILNAVDEGTDYYEMFHRENMGFSAACENSDKLAKDILYLYNNPQERQACGERAKVFARKYYSRGANTKLYIELFRELTQSL